MAEQPAEFSHLAVTAKTWFLICLECGYSLTYLHRCGPVKLNITSKTKVFTKITCTAPWGLKKYLKSLCSLKSFLFCTLTWIYLLFFSICSLALFLSLTHTHIPAICAAGLETFINTLLLQLLIFTHIESLHLSAPRLQSSMFAVIVLDGLKRRLSTC